MTPIRQYALDFLTRATNGPHGVKRGDAPYERITEGRHTAAVRAGLFYSACGDLAQALLFACGVRDKRFINRAENGPVSGDPYRVGWNVVELNALALALRGNPNAIAAGDILNLEPGDITIVWNRADTTDAHVAVVREFEDSLVAGAASILQTSDYGQGSPKDGKQNARTVDGVYIGTRKLQRIINLEEAVARFATVEPIPLDVYFGGVQEKPVTNIETLQTLLNDHGTSPKLVVDGNFGPKSKAALKAFLGPKAWAVVEDRTK